MTVDIEKLEALAKAAPAGPWYGPDELAQKGTVFDCDLGSLLSYESIESERDACVAYVAAANPAAVLELIAKVERLVKQLGDRPAYRTPEYESKRDAMWRRAHMVATSKGYDHINMAIAAAPTACADCMGCGGEWQGEGRPNSVCEICKGNRGKTLEAERDQLKAELAALKTGYEAYERVNAELRAEIDRLNDEYDKAWRHDLNDKNNVQALAAEVARLSAECEALRKNSARYQWLRDESESIHQFYLSTPIWFTGVKFSKENVDSTIDAAMSKEQSHD